jgi:rRNA processing protein Gar1
MIEAYIAIKKQNMAIKKLLKHKKMYFEIKKLKKIRHFRRLKNTEAMIYDR